MQTIHVAKEVPPSSTLTVEEAYRRCLEFCARAEETFRQIHGALPDLSRQSDFDALMQNANPSMAAQDFARPDGSGRSLITRYDLALSLFRSHAERALPVPEMFLPQAAAWWDALLGRLHYNLPAREYEYRMKRLELCSPELSLAGVSPWLDKLLSLAVAVRNCEVESNCLEGRMKDAFGNPCIALIKSVRDLKEQGVSEPAAAVGDRLLKQLAKCRQLVEAVSARNRGYESQYL